MENQLIPNDGSIIYYVPVDKKGSREVLGNSRVFAAGMILTTMKLHEIPWEYVSLLDVKFLVNTIDLEEMEGSVSKEQLLLLKQASENFSEGLNGLAEDQDIFTFANDDGKITMLIPLITILDVMNEGRVLAIVEEQDENGEWHYRSGYLPANSFSDKVPIGEDVPK